MTPVERFAALVISHPMNQHVADSAEKCGLLVAVPNMLGGGTELSAQGHALVRSLQDILDDEEIAGLKAQIVKIEDRKARRAAGL